MSDVNANDAKSGGGDYSGSELEAIWQEFQKEGEETSCPACGGEVEVTLDNDPAEGGSGTPEVSMTCTNCGREGEFRPGADTYGWKE